MITKLDSVNRRERGDYLTITRNTHGYPRKIDELAAVAVVVVMLLWRTFYDSHRRTA